MNLPQPDDRRFTEAVHRMQIAGILDGLEGVEHASMLNEASKRIMAIATGDANPDDVADTMDLVVIGLMANRMRHLLPEVPEILQ
jgi:hypothetical protein